MPFFKRRKFASRTKKDMPEGIFQKCPSCNERNASITLEQRFQVCPNCNYHFPLPVDQRITMLTDPGTFEEIDATIESTNPLNFKGYPDKIKNYQKKLKTKDSVITGRANIVGAPVTLGIMDFRFLGASMGSAAGEKLTRAIELATKEERGVVFVCASGGARMHEGIFSLMQMAKTSGALARHAEAGLPYIPILTDPTTGGVTASFATLGDVILAEPKAMIGFAGPRVIKETTHQTLPPGFQRSEFLKEHGLIDMIVDRGTMREKLGFLLNFMMETNPVVESPLENVEEATDSSEEEPESVESEE